MVKFIQIYRTQAFYQMSICILHLYLHVAEEDDFLVCELLRWLPCCEVFFSHSMKYRRIWRPFVALHHSQFFGCIEGEVVVLAVADPPLPDVCFPKLESKI